MILTHILTLPSPQSSSPRGTNRTTAADQDVRSSTADGDIFPCVRCRIIDVVPTNSPPIKSRPPKVERVGAVPRAIGRSPRYCQLKISNPVQFERWLEAKKIP
jgi:hypothetical protein